MGNYPAIFHKAISSVFRPRKGERPAMLHSEKVRIFQKTDSATLFCKRNIEMTPLCKIEVTLPRVLGSREMRLGGVIDEQAGVQPS
jgi:hypothetical protein